MPVFLLGKRSFNVVMHHVRKSSSEMDGCFYAFYMVGSNAEKILYPGPKCSQMHMAALR